MSSKKHDVKLQSRIPILLKCSNYIKRIPCAKMVIVVILSYIKLSNKLPQKLVTSNKNQVFVHDSGQFFCWSLLRSFLTSSNHLVARLRLDIKGGFWHLSGAPDRMARTARGCPNLHLSLSVSLSNRAAGSFHVVVQHSQEEVFQKNNPEHASIC